MSKSKQFGRCGAAAAVALTVALSAISPAVAGEITGNGKSLKNADGTLNGNSLCAYSGRNDSPNGFTLPNGVIIDPGGDVQSYGYFLAQMDFLPNPSDPAAREAFSFPGNSCNPSTSTGGH